MLQCFWNDFQHDICWCLLISDLLLINREHRRHMNIQRDGRPLRLWALHSHWSCVWPSESDFFFFFGTFKVTTYCSVNPSTTEHCRAPMLKHGTSYKTGILINLFVQDIKRPSRACSSTVYIEETLKYLKHKMICLIIVFLFYLYIQILHVYTVAVPRWYVPSMNVWLWSMCTPRHAECLK